MIYGSRLQLERPQDRGIFDRFRLCQKARPCTTKFIASILLLSSDRKRSTIMSETILVLVSEILSNILPISDDRKLGLGKELEKLAQIILRMKAFFLDVQDINPDYLRNLRSIAFNAEVLVDKIAYEVLRRKIEIRKSGYKARILFDSSNPLSFRRRMAQEIKTIISSLQVAFEEFKEFLAPSSRVDLISTRRHQGENLPTTSILDAEAIVGRENDVSEVIRMLMRSDSGEELAVISIVGMAGLGKTTLAQLVYNHDQVRCHFQTAIWICVSQIFDAERIMNDMLQLLGVTGCEMISKEAKVRRLRQLLNGIRYLLVLDDVWNESEEQWHDFRRCLLGSGGSRGSKILITTRSRRVAEIVQTSDFGIYMLQTLPDDLSWMLFKKIAFRHQGEIENPELVEIGQSIVKKCGGLPLAIKAIAKFMYCRKDPSEWVAIGESELWNDPLNDVFKFSVLKFCYDNLPSAWLKRCFACCSIFQKGTLIEKEKLIQIWMAQGFINPPNAKSSTLEDIGTSYFNVLLQNSLLQDPQKDLYGNITHCRMHDVLHDLSLFVSKNHSFVVDGLEGSHILERRVNTDVEALHLSFINSAEWKMLKIPEGRLKNLRTFSVKGGRVVLEDVFTNFRYLFVLIVEDEDVKNLPEGIDKLKHLRYLDISRTKIRFLPKSFTKLYNLQTLRVFDLIELPNGFDKLINLRHFYIEGYCHNPLRNLLLPKIGHLTKIQTLPFFLVSQEKGCQIKELEYLDNLGGTLTIYGLQNMNSYESALKAQLSKKFRIQSLELHWEGPSKNFNDNAMLEGLKPHSNLKSLKIVGFQGSNFPLWMVKQEKFLLHNLVELQLEHLDEFEKIPSLGEILCLKILKINMLPKIKCLGSDFFGSAKTIFFPALREFELCRMPGLVEWSDAGLVEWSDALIPEHLSAEVFPNLEKLRLHSLPKLVHLPKMGNLNCLRQFEVSYCQSLTSLPNLNGLTSLQVLDIICCPNLTHLSEDIDGLHGLLSLENLCISKCPNLVAIPHIHNLLSLRKLQIESCDSLTASISRVGTLSSLEFLDIYSDPAFWPGDIHYLTSLRTLHLGGFSDDVDYFPWSYSISGSPGASGHGGDIEPHFVSLASLQLYGWPTIRSLPEQVQYISTLRNLTIIRFNALEALPEWLGNLKCLQKLELFACQNLRYLPSTTAMQCLTGLQTLRISRCPLLKERCTRGSGEEWTKIAHIPNIHISTS